MARINIEDSLFNDVRFDDLVKELGSKAMAIGEIVLAWRVAQQYWKHSDHGIPRPVWNRQRLSDAIIKAGLAEDTGDFIRMRGSHEQFQWLRDKVQSGSKGGKASVISRAKKSEKEMVPRNHSEKIQAPSSTFKHSQPSYSSSLSISKNKELKTPPAAASPDGSPTALFIGTYVKAYQARYGPQARPSLDGKTQGSIKRVLSSVPLDRACQMIQVYMQLDDPWFKTKAHDFETFAQNLTKVGLALDTGRRPEGSRRGIQEILAEKENDQPRIRQTD